jgi:hypothetical protein
MQRHWTSNVDFMNAKARKIIDGAHKYPRDKRKLETNKGVLSRVYELSGVEEE